MESIYLFFKNDLKTNIIELSTDIINFHTFVFWDAKLINI